MGEDIGNPKKPELPSDEDIAERFRKVRADLEKMKLPEYPGSEADETPASESTKSGKKYNLPEIPDIPIRNTKTKAKQDAPGDYNYRSLGIGMSAAYSLIGSMIVGFGLGWCFDHFTHNNYGQVLGALGGSVLGIVSAIILINRDGGGKP